ncbi:MAG: hypothetical protein C0621_09755 [Desulfuromonas sp.]|nr:MAG: hypothetical protein C0621_09755 [Desulfuromonas sp.]
MPKKAFHVPDEHIETYEKFKETIEAQGETISGVLINFMRNYIAEEHAHLQGVEEFFLWEGTRDYGAECSGRLVRFYGKKIASATGDIENNKQSQILYYTKKRKFLLYRETEIEGAGIIKSKITIKDTFGELSCLLPGIISETNKSRDVAELLDV